MERDCTEASAQARHFPIRTDTMLPAGSYAGKVVLVTGGGTGLGKGMATKFSQLGAKVDKDTDIVGT